MADFALSASVRRLSKAQQLCTAITEIPNSSTSSPLLQFEATGFTLHAGATISRLILLIRQPWSIALQTRDLISRLTVNLERIEDSVPL